MRETAGGGGARGFGGAEKRRVWEVSSQAGQGGSPVAKRGRRWGVRIESGQLLTSRVRIISLLNTNFARRTVTTFGGTWTEEKLEKVTQYLMAYQKVMKNQSFRTVYVDAFCGDGAIALNDAEADDLEEGRRITKGSAVRALELATPFDAYHFIDKSASSVAKLKETAATVAPTLAERVETHPADVNAALPNIISGLDPRSERAVVFVDPFGMQLEWRTIEVIAKQPGIDFWYLVPIGIAVNRLATKDQRRMSSAWATKLDAFLGTKDWRNDWYAASSQQDLFSTDAIMERRVNIDKIDDYFHNRLGQAFAAVATNRLRLGKTAGKPLYTLMFACSNPSPKACGAAMRIANHLLKS
jgi:three-Cys-motif partner protein